MEEVRRRGMGVGKGGDFREQSIPYTLLGKAGAQEAKCVRMSV